MKDMLARQTNDNLRANNAIIERTTKKTTSSNATVEKKVNIKSKNLPHQGSAVHRIQDSFPAEKYPPRKLLMPCAAKQRKRNILKKPHQQARTHPSLPHRAALKRRPS
jgi:hypothetical protein